MVYRSPAPDLHNETVAQLRNTFIPEKRMLKKVVDELIANDYLKRDEENMNLVVYVPG